MRRALALLPLAILVGGCLPVEGARVAQEQAATERYGRTLAPILKSLNATTSSDLKYLQRETVRLTKAGDEEGLYQLQGGYLRQYQRVAVKALGEIDELGPVPGKFARLMEFHRKILKLRIATGRAGAEAMIAGDQKRLATALAQEAKELVPLQRELRTESEALIAEGKKLKAEEDGGKS